MSNYVQTTFFTPKDTLPTTNPAKTIFGAAYDVEFGNIAAAILSKYDNTTAAPSLLSLTVGSPTGGNLGAGSINAQSIFINNVAASIAVGANPSGIVGLAAVNGSATSWMRSDGAPALSQAIAPTWTSNHTFAPTSGVAIVITGAAAANAFTFQATVGAIGTVNTTNAGGGYITWQTSGVSIGDIGAALANVGFGTNADMAIAARGANSLYLSTNGLNRVQIAGDGGVTVGAPTGGDQGLGTLNAVNLFVQGVAVATGVAGTTGSFTAGTTGLSGATSACKWTKIGTSVTMFMGLPSTLVSSTTGFTLTGLPAAIQPATAKYAAGPGLGLNNSALINNVDAQVSGSVITFSITGLAAAWTASGNKTVGDGTTGATFVWDTN